MRPPPIPPDFHASFRLFHLLRTPVLTNAFLLIVDLYVSLDQGEVGQQVNF